MARKSQEPQKEGVDSFFTINEIAEKLAVNYDTVLKMVRCGQIRGINLNPGDKRGIWRVSKADYQQYLDSRYESVP